MKLEVDILGYLFPGKTPEAVDLIRKNLSDSERQELDQLLVDAYEEARFDKLSFYKPFPKQELFHASGRIFNQLMFSAGNQLGKTYCGAAHAAFHLTGRYPDWWRGKRYDGPTNGWAAGVNAQTTRDTIQSYLLGPHTDKAQWGSGMLPRDCIVGNPSPSPGNVKNAVDTIVVKHVSGGQSTIGFKNFEQGREAWQGPPKDWIWLDEEPGEQVYGEALARTYDTDGDIYLTFTPLQGYSEVVATFYNDGKDITDSSIDAVMLMRNVDKAYLRMTVDDREDLTKEQRARRIAKVPKHERAARLYGMPHAGEGGVFSGVDYDTVVVPPKEIPKHWKRIAGIDFGWDHPTAAVLAAQNPETGQFIVYEEYRREKTKPLQHWEALKQWNSPVWAWPRDGLQQKAGEGFRDMYKNLGMPVLKEPAHWRTDDGKRSIAVEPMIQAMIQDFEVGQLLITENCTMLLEEMRRYIRKRVGRDETKPAEIYKKNDDLIDAMRYAYVMRRYAKTTTKNNYKKSTRRSNSNDPRLRTLYGGAPARD